MSDKEILLQVRDDVRDELKQRITQRDNFAIQFTVLALALVTLAFSADKFAFSALALFPIISLFYCMLIDSSYRVHERLVEYLNTEIEPKIEEGSKIKLWEHYCRDVRALECNNAPSGRKRFFHAIAICSPAISAILLVTLHKLTILYIAYTIICTVVGGVIVYSSNHYVSYTGLNKLSFCDYERKERLTDEPQKAIFFDRDGTLHVDKVMTHKLKDLELLPGAAELVAKAHVAGYKVIIVTNQSAIGKGYYSIFRMHLFNMKLRLKLKYVDAIYFCPHTKEAHCHCRKPDTGMFKRAKNHYNLDLSQCIMVGDRMSDILAAQNAGVSQRIFVTTGIYASDYYNEPHFNDVEHETVHSLCDIKLDNIQ